MNLKISHNNESDTCLKSLSSFRADDGILYPLHFSDLPFKVQRFFLVRDVPIGERRGNHAHYVNKTYLVCAQGEIDVFLHNGNSEFKYSLKVGDGVFVDNLIWDSQVYRTGKDILLSFCSIDYDPDDYIHDFDKFKLLMTK
jgi:UDP-2-acetamido-3-amino-2,3-dideoxy-glucuronate N-acetyltransferase